MFKSLIGTFLLTSSIGFQKPIEKANNYNFISGFYTLNDVITPFDFGTDEFNDYITFDADNDIELYVTRTGEFNKVSIVPCILEELYIEVNTYDMEATFNLTYTVATGYDDGTYTISFDYIYEDFTLEDMYLYIERNDDMRLNDTRNFLRNFMLYFNKPVGLVGEQLTCFNNFFNATGNKYTSRYMGWYTYKNGAWFNGDYIWDIQDMTFMVDNNYYSAYVHQSDIVEYVGTTFVTDNYFTYVMYEEPNVYHTSRPVHINGFLPYTVREIMATEGVFDYVVVPTETTWYEMILAVMDAPIYYLSQLLGFKLFGIELFVAFTSILTLLIIVTIIRKVI